MLVSQTHFLWFITLMTISLAGGWIVVEIGRLRRALADDRRDPVVRDRIFGSIIGLMICVVGVVGSIAYHL